MGGGLENRCVNRVYGADGAVRHSHGTIRTIITFSELLRYVNLVLNVLNYNLSKEQYMLSENDRVIETCRSVKNVLT